MLQIFAVCCSKLRCVAVYCRVLQSVAVRCCLSQCLAVDCCVWLRVSALVNFWYKWKEVHSCSEFQRVSACCSVLECTTSLLKALHKSQDILESKLDANLTIQMIQTPSFAIWIPRQHTATRCNTLQHTTTRCNRQLCRLALCNTLQHTATDCNTLQHTATHCNTLQLTATHCNNLPSSAIGYAPPARPHFIQSTSHYTLQHIATYCNTLQLTATHCNSLQHTATHCNTLQHTATHCNTLQQATLPSGADGYAPPACAMFDLVDVTRQVLSDTFARLFVNIAGFVYVKTKQGVPLPTRDVRTVSQVCVVVCCRALLCVAGCCCVLQGGVVCCRALRDLFTSSLSRVCCYLLVMYALCRRTVL